LINAKNIWEREGEKKKLRNFPVEGIGRGGKKELKRKTKRVIHRHRHWMGKNTKKKIYKIYKKSTHLWLEKPSLLANIGTNRPKNKRKTQPY